MYKNNYMLPIKTLSDTTDLIKKESQVKRCKFIPRDRKMTTHKKNRLCFDPLSLEGIITEIQVVGWVAFCQENGEPITQDSLQTTSLENHLKQIVHTYGITLNDKLLDKCDNMQQWNWNQEFHRKDDFTGDECMRYDYHMDDILGRTPAELISGEITTDITNIVGVALSVNALNTVPSSSYLSIVELNREARMRFRDLGHIN